MAAAELDGRDYRWLQAEWMGIASVLHGVLCVCILIKLLLRKARGGVRLTRAHYSIIFNQENGARQTVILCVCVCMCMTK